MKPAGNVSVWRENGISFKTGYVWLKDKIPLDFNVYKKKEDNV